MFNLFLPLFNVYAQSSGPIKEWGDCVVDDVPTLKCLEVVFGNILYMSSFFIILVLFIMFVVGSFRYLTSFGNAERIKKAQGTLKFALIGFILFVSAFLILTIIQKLFLGSSGTNLFEFNIGQ